MALDQVIIKEREDKLRSLNLDPNEILRKLNQDTLPSIEKIDEAVEYFKNELGFESKQFQRLPALFNLSIKYNLKPKVEYFKNEIGFENKQFQRLPALLTFSIEDNLKPKVEYYRNELGFENKQFKSHPVLLGLSIEDNIKPTVKYFKNELGFKNKQFQINPFLLTYSLEKRIKPRTEFLRIKQRNIPSNFLSSGDELFCKNLAKCPLEEYESFKGDYLKK